MSIRRLVCAVLIVCSSLPAAAQSPDDANAPRLISRSELVVVPVIVTRSGKHVSGLTKDDFSLFQEKQRQTIVHFEEVTTDRASVPLAANPDRDDNEFSNVGMQAPMRFTIIVMDMPFIEFADFTYAKQGLLKYLKENVDVREPIALLAVTRTGITVIHDFTTSPAVLTAAVQRLSATPASLASALPERLADPVLQQEGNEAIEQEAAQLGAALSRAENRLNEITAEAIKFETIRHLRILARAYAGIPGRKSLIWVGARTPFTYADPVGSRSPFPYANPMYPELLQQLADANMSVYPVDARGLLLLRPMALQSHSGSAYQPVPGSVGVEYDPTLEEMRWVADATGGRAFLRTNDIAGSIDRASQDSASYYQLSYYVKPDTKRGWHKLSVDVNQPHVDVRSRSGFFAGKPLPLPAAEQELAQMLQSPYTLTGVPFTVRWLAQTASTPQGKRVDYRVSIPARGLTVDDRRKNRIRLTMVLSVRNAEGTELHKITREIDTRVGPQLEQFAKTGLNFNSAFAIAPGEYTAKFLIRDNTSGQIGTLTAALEVKP